MKVAAETEEHGHDGRKLQPIPEGLLHPFSQTGACILPDDRPHRTRKRKQSYGKNQRLRLNVANGNQRSGNEIC